MAPALTVMPCSIRKALDPAAHRVLKDLAEREDKKLQDLIFEGVNLMLQSYGEKPIA